MPRCCRILVLLLFCTSPVLAEQLRIYHIDVEQASSTLFVAPGGKTLLVDSGKNGMGSRIKAVMERAGVTQIDFFVDTHYHEDHYGGIDDLVALGVHVLESYDRGDKAFLPATKLAEPAYKGYIASVGEDAQHITRGMTIPLDPLMTVTCISSGGVVIGEENPPAPGNDENDLSVSLLITFGDFRYFIGGDIEAPTEQKIADRDLVKDVDVYVADHHGSDTSSPVVFMRDLTPRVIIVSNGNHGTYNHPRQTTLNMYAELPSPPTVYQVNKCFKGSPCGNVADSLIADPQTVDADGTIQLVADTTLHTYTVSFESGTAKTFQFRNITPPGPAGIVITSLLPNPVGDDAQMEEITLKNKGSTPLSITGWTLVDRSGLQWQLAGSINAGQSKLFRRNGMGMTLNNGGDEITLFDAAHAERDHFKYEASTEGTVITTNH